jgi:hypothetical protein
MSNATILIPRKAWTKPEILKSYEATGRKRAQTAGAHVAGMLSELKKAIWLCPDCHHKFDWKKHRYYNVWKFDKTTVNANCDACKAFSSQCRLFLYEPTVPRAWLTKDENRRVRRHAITIGA